MPTGKIDKKCKKIKRRVGFLEFNALPHRQVVPVCGKCNRVSTGGNAKLSAVKIELAAGGIR